MLGAESAKESEERYDKHIAFHRPESKVDMIGIGVCQAAVMILRDIGRWANGRKINSRGDMEEGAGP